MIVDASRLLMKWRVKHQVGASFSPRLADCRWEGVEDAVAFCWASKHGPCLSVQGKPITGGSVFWGELVGGTGIIYAPISLPTCGLRGDADSAK